jgi:hypothetical protein
MVKNKQAILLKFLNLIKIKGAKQETYHLIIKFIQVQARTHIKLSKSISLKILIKIWGNKFRT